MKKRVNAVELGIIMWRMNQIAILVHHDYARSSLRYDRGKTPAHEFAQDIMGIFTRDALAPDIVEKWRDAVLVLPDGTEEPMDPSHLAASIMRFRQERANG